MEYKHLIFILCAIAAWRDTLAQNDNEISFSQENDDLITLDIPKSEDAEGSGSGITEDPFSDPIETSTIPPLEDFTTESSTGEENQTACPDVCSCSTEGEFSFTVNCANQGLKDFPSNLDPRTTTLNLRQNHITVIPSTISSLKNLKVLLLDDNSIMSIAHGSISELPGLVKISLGNNRLLEYPQDLKNSMSLNNLEDLDLGRNDIREPISVHHLFNLKNLRKIVLPEASKDEANNICEYFSESMEVVCISTCETDLVECPNKLAQIGDEFLEANLPGTIALSNSMADTLNQNEGTEKYGEVSADADPKNIQKQSTKNTSISNPEEITSENDYSLRTAVDKEKLSIMQTKSGLRTPLQEPVDTPTDTNIKIGAATTSTDSGAVDKTVIGLIVAGMIVVIAGIAIKKNWTSLKSRFSSAPRAANTAQANGAAQEMVPLQDQNKSPA